MTRPVGPVRPDEREARPGWGARGATRLPVEAPTAPDREFRRACGTYADGMELTVPLDEAVAVLRATGALPSAVTHVTGRGSSVLASVNVHELPGVAAGIKTAARFAGPFEAQLDDRGVAGRTWTLELRVSHPVLRFDLSSFVTTAVQQQLAKAPTGIATVRSENGATVVDVDLDRAADLLPTVLPATRGLRPRIDTVSLGAGIRLTASVATR
jgi:hypothetical protein